jgi:WD40 repeat protein
VHKSDINTVDWNPLNDNLIATGSEDTLVKLIDIRRVNGKDNPIVKTLHKHSSKVQGVKFCPFNSRFLASSGDSLIFWDIKDVDYHFNYEINQNVEFDC